MKSLRDQSSREAILTRIHRLSPASSRRWGTMTINQAIVHVTDPLRDALAERKTRRVIPRFLAPLVKPIVLSKKPFKPGTPSLKPYDQSKDLATKPTNFNDDLAQLIERINRFAECETFGEHPGLGKLNADEWGRLLYKELDHHLRQFGV